MDRRAQRIGENEILFREVNERLLDLHEQFDVTAEVADFLCECGRADCVEKVALSIQDYERMRADPAMFAVVPGHEEPDVEYIVELVGETALIRKREGGPAELAAEHDPRA